MSNPVISAIITTYNPGQYLREAVESLIDQSIISMMEVIIVDDGSDKEHAVIIDELLKNYNHIGNLILLRKKNGGLSSARNFGIDHVRGEYIMFCDDDDIYHQKAAETLLNMIESEGADMALGALTDAKHNLKSTGNVRVYSGRDAAFYTLHKTSALHNSSSSVLFKKELFKHRRYPEGQLYEDLGCNPYLMFNSGKVIVLDAPLYFYRQRKGSLIHTFNPKRVAVLDITAKLVEDFSSDLGLKNAAIDRSFGAACNLLVHSYKEKTTRVFTVQELQTLRNRCKEIIRKYRRIVLHDPEARKLNRLGARLSYLFI